MNRDKELRVSVRNVKKQKKTLLPQTVDNANIVHEPFAEYVDIQIY